MADIRPFRGIRYDMTRVGALSDVIGTPLAMAVSCVAALGCIALVAQRFPLLRDRPDAIAAPAGANATR